MIKETSIVAVEENLTVAELEGEAVVLDLSSGCYYGLNKVGARILELAKQPTPVSEILEVLQQQYNVEAEQLKRDVLVFMQTMLDKQIIRNDGVASQA